VVRAAGDDYQILFAPGSLHAPHNERRGEAGEEQRLIGKHGLPFEAERGDIGEGKRVFVGGHAGALRIMAEGDPLSGLAGRGGNNCKGKQKDSEPFVEHL
jgi:hypothetical protein